MNEVSGFTFFRSYYDSLLDLSPEDKYEMIISILEYIFEDKEPELIGIKKMAWTLIKPNLATSKSRSCNGTQKGKQKKAKESKQKQKKAKESNDLQNKDKEMENGYEIENGKEMDGNCIETNNDIYSYLEKNFCRTISSLEYEKLNNLLKEFDEAVIQRAIDECVLNQVKTFKYLEGILNNWRGQNLKTINEVKEHELKFNKNKYSRSNDPIPEVFDYNWLDDDE